MKKAEFGKGLGFSLLVLYLIVASLRPIETEDIWWQLSAGRFIVTSHHIPQEDPFVFAAEKTPWTHTQWLGSCLYYGVYRFLGEEGLRWFRVFLFLSVFMIFLCYAHKKIPQLLLGFLIFIMSFGLGSRAFLRPDFFNFLFLQFLLIALLNYDRHGNRVCVFWIPLLGFIWFNIHLGSFVYGSIILLTFWFAKLIEVVRFKVDQLSKTDERTIALRGFQGLSLCVVGYYASFLFNPYGLRGFVYPFRVFFDPGFIGYYQFNTFIAEQQPPAYVLTLTGAWFYVLVLMVIFVWQRSLQKKLSHLLLFMVALFMFLFSQRASAFFVLVAGYLIVENWNEDKFHERLLGREALLRAGLIVLLVANIVRAVHKHCYVDGRRARKIFQQEDVLSPQSAVRLLLENNIEGKVFNSDRYGGYLIWHGYPLRGLLRCPRLRPFVDGRQLNKDRWDAYRRVVSHPEIYWPIFEKRFGFDAALINAKDAFNNKILPYLANQPGWQLAAVDGYAVLFVKKTAGVLPEHLKNYVESLRAAPFDEKKVEKILARSWPKEKGWAGAARRFLFPEPYFVNALQEGMTLYDLGFQEAGIAKVIEANQVSPSAGSQSILRLMMERFEQKP